ncbi:indolepyruvate ferredoxin oxidoreductase family protein [Cupriavidus basilensis]
MNNVLARTGTTLDDKYQAQEGWLYMTGMQALVRLPIQQRLRDTAAGWNTGAYISGYRGSPVGRYDMELWAAETLLKEHNIQFRAGLNEDLAATAIWGAQYVGSFPGARVDGVFGIWYGKGPGVDRSGDVLRHANLAGTSPKGGVVCLAGDDHGAKSSTVANFSDQIFIAVGMPVLYPSNTQELLDYGLHGIAMSRFSGCWVGMKVVTDVVEGGGSVYVSPDSPQIRMPESARGAADMLESDGYHIRSVDAPLPQEERLYHHKHQAVMAYARANRLNRVTLDPDHAKIGIVSAGKSWQDVLEAMANLGLDEARAAELGIRMLKIGMIWPLDPAIVREFAQGLETIIVVEEKRPVLEDQLRAALYGGAAPRIVGKHQAGGVFDPARGPMAFPNAGELSPQRIAAVIADTLRLHNPACGLNPLTAPAAKADASGMPSRMPGFCSGCPHNRSTQLPEGSRALAGIGCHTIAARANPLRTTTVSQMGGEGVMWLGQQAFTDEKHVFANIGDGTFAHSGFLAVRQAVAAGVPMTYKILYNGFVSMTGGQPVETEQPPQQILHGLAAEGVRKMAVVTDEPQKYRDISLPPDTPVHHRSQMDAVQREFREYPGVSVILYDQACATERRRLRKRGKLPDPAKRAFINPAVCEGCGDCGKASNCMSIEPLETEFGRKRRINQGSCNKDYSCVDGFCPSFVTVHGGKLRNPKAGNGGPRQPEWTQALPEPDIASLTDIRSVMIVGIGGTGVVTIGQTLAMAAHLQGYYTSNLDITGISQKYGAVNSHVRIAPRPGMLHATRIGAGDTSTLVGCDLVVAAGDETVSTLRLGTSQGVICTDLIPTAEFAGNPDWNIDADVLVQRLRHALGDDVLLLEGQRLAIELMGDAIAANMLMLGAAWQRGLVPISLAAMHRAIDLNGVAVAMNKDAFLWGRRAAHDLPAVERFVRETRAPANQIINFVPRTRRSVAEIVRSRGEHLKAYGGQGPVRRYEQLVQRVADAERHAGLGDALSRAVATSYHKLLAVKDEWEVARLYSHPDFQAALRKEFEGEYTLRFHVGAWPFSTTDDTGKPVKGEVGPWLMTAFRWMTKFRFLRGSVLDPFRNNAERRLERHLVSEYERDIDRLLDGINVQTYDVATRIAALPESVRGFGHVKEASAAKASEARAALIAELEQRLAGPKPPQAGQARVYAVT